MKKQLFKLDNWSDPSASMYNKHSFIKKKLEFATRSILFVVFLNFNEVLLLLEQRRFALV